MLEMSLRFMGALFSVTLLLPTQVYPTSSNSNPVVDLGAYYNFTNIRYAAPPLAQLRFAAPQKPAVADSSKSVDNGGTFSKACPQVIPEWEHRATDFVPSYLLARSTNKERDFDTLSKEAALRYAGVESEDCLFLDVLTPKSIFEHGIWIHSGGYVQGSKTNDGDPAGLIKASNESLVFVAINYRLGAFGWLSGSVFQKQGGASNAALYDQRLALQWVQDHITRFGGDPRRVTVMGESAGGGSIMHQITAYGGKILDRPFGQAILQSPGFLPIVSESQQDSTFADFLKLAGVSNLTEARNLPSSRLMVANANQVITADYGTFVYGPAVDHSFVPDLPGHLLQRGASQKGVKTMIGHNTNEGLYLVPETIKTARNVKNALRDAFPALSNSSIDSAVHTYYPISQFQDITEQAAAIEADLAFVCNTYYLKPDFSYVYGVFPALHGSDVATTFYTGPDANVLQHWIAEFATGGQPFQSYGKGRSILLADNGTQVIQHEEGVKYHGSPKQDETSTETTAPTILTII
ncbi:carboxylesterase family protein-like protein [Venturia nashicola]|uniref:Carboxylic ester hydrolase n=1 Tax=Venturia nashicola TaxID=86259 RepID=A0A4Z1P2C3_9PEZI|nr:carboxylesterase family protein-like protein [Venturia nashicola]